MAFSKATPPKVPKSLGLVTLTLWAAPNEAVNGSVEVQIVDSDDAPYERQVAPFPPTVSQEALDLAMKLFAVVREEAEKEILAG